MKTTFFFLFFFPLLLQAQADGCTFKPPFITIHFGAGNVRDLNVELPAGYRRITGDCPSDGFYAYAPFTNDCFGGDWLDLPEDHTPGDVAGNMMLVNAAWRGGPFLTTALSGLKANTIYKLGVWMMNVCKPSDKCPFPLLPNISIELQTPDGRTVAQFSTGQLLRRTAPLWTEYQGIFTMPTATSLTLVMTDNAPGGCGNDFVLDDISFSECVKPLPVVVKVIKAPPVIKRPTAKPAEKKERPPVVKRQTTISQTSTPQILLPPPAAPALKQRTLPLPTPPQILTARQNPVIKSITAQAGEIKLDLYDNGEIDGDTVSIYHNNALLVSRAGLSQKPVSFRLTVDAAHPHHELIMVAENLGSIPPNTSLMIVTTATQRYEIFISSSEQTNAKLVIDLKQ